MGSWKMHAGINHAPAYEVSGKPFASGSLNATNATKIAFPYVTRWIYVINHGAEDCRVGFSEAGVRGDSVWIASHDAGTNYFEIGREVNNVPGTCQRLELKVGELWLSGSPQVDVVAGLTTIRTESTSMGAGLRSWSGSVGVSGQAL